MKKFPFFLPTPWTKPWEKNIASFSSRCFHTPEKIVFFLVRPQTLFLDMFCLKRKDEEISILFCCCCFFFRFFFCRQLYSLYRLTVSTSAYLRKIHIYTPTPHRHSHTFLSNASFTNSHRLTTNVQIHIQR